MAAAMTPNEEAQLAQTIEMFEVITVSQPLDYQSLEILKEAYFKLGRQKDVVNTSKRIAQAYMNLGQLSSAILEYESILQRYPEDPDVKSALAEIESKASSLGTSVATPEAPAPELVTRAAQEKRAAPAEMDDGRAAMHKLFVEGRLLSAPDFDHAWQVPNPAEPIRAVVEPFIGHLAERALLALETSLKLLSERSRLAYVPLERYDVDLELTRTFPREVCLRHAVLPFDRLSKSVLVATANPFNKQAVADLERATRSRLLWYLSPPAEIVKYLRKAFR